jgi:hypothetical protein
MKKIGIILSIVAGFAILFTACGKYEEGPAFSLKTKKARIVGTWGIKEITVNGNVQDLGGFANRTFELKKDGTGKLNTSFFGTTISVDMEWKFDDNKENLMIRMKNQNNEWKEWKSSEIIKLTSSELWFRDVETENGETITTITKLEKK